MEVVLKKTKITNGLLKQVPVINTKLIGNYKVLGWCKDSKGWYWTVFYNEKTNELVKNLRTQKVETKTEPNGTVYIVVTSVHSLRANNQTIAFDETLYKLWCDHVTESEAKGQFFM